MYKKVPLVVLMLMLAGSLASAAETENPRVIQVTGTAEQEVIPDQVIWRLSIDTMNLSLMLAKTENDAKAEALKAVRDALEIDPEDMAIGRVSARREYEHDEHGRQGAFKHYKVNRTILAKQRDLSRFDEFFDAFVSVGGIEVSFSFESSQMVRLRWETRRQAVQAAQRKAREMAGELNAKVGSPLKIVEESRLDGRQSPYLNISNGMTPSSGPPAVDLTSDAFAPDLLRSRVTVYIDFELE